MSMVMEKVQVHPPLDQILLNLITAITCPFIHFPKAVKVWQMTSSEPLLESV